MTTVDIRKTAALTFGRQSTKRSEQLSETQVVLAGHSLRFFTTQDGHHRDERVLDELLDGLNALRHVGAAAPQLQYTGK